MSVLVFSDARTACSAAATVVAGELLTNPSFVLGLDADESFLPMFRSLSAMTDNGILSWDKSKVFLLKEYVLAGEPMENMLSEALSRSIPCLESILEVPPGSSKDWASDCEYYEEKIIASGGLDLAVVSVSEDGTVLFNAPNEEMAPVTHVEAVNGSRTVTLGMATLMQARKLIVLLTGMEKAAVAQKLVKGGIDSSLPVSLLKLHGELTVILDEEAASLL